jgi:drug/metabolite transporter (DMT)-like permease
MFACLNIAVAGAIMLVLTPVIAWTPVHLTGWIVASLLVLGEVLSWNEPVGALIVIIGILFAQKRLRLSRGAIFSENG